MTASGAKVLIAGAVGGVGRAVGLATASEGASVSEVVMRPTGR
jgi:NAD(P)-dependent dehydrogenase (short-subunit alcohol dehydrogenase family)